MALINNLLKKVFGSKAERDMKEIKPILITTLSEINPQFNLPKEKRYLSIFSQTENISSKNLPF